MLDSSAQPMPLRRTEQVTVQHVGEETLLYDERTHQAFCLDKITTPIWNACDGTRTRLPWLPCCIRKQTASPGKLWCDSLFPGWS